jgi:predicted acyltransferase
MATFLYWLPGVWRVVTVIVFLVGLWALIRFYPVPGMEPGIFTEEHNVIAYINQIYLQPLHLKVSFLLLPASAMELLGTITGNIFTV